MNDNLVGVTRTLRDLIRSLPAVRAHCEADALKRHVALIAHYRRRHDRLANGFADVRSDTSSGQRQGRMTERMAGRLNAG